MLSILHSYGSSMCLVPAQAASNPRMLLAQDGAYGDLLQPEMKHAQCTHMALPAALGREAQAHMWQHLPVTDNNHFSAGEPPAFRIRHSPVSSKAICGRRLLQESHQLLSRPCRTGVPGAVGTLTG